ncbi:MAG: hypothetical protein J6K92_08505 [Oscillospiraceae bacterium]|nr:hypothetical protein [Oscillospiraceae bacterium]
MITAEELLEKAPSLARRNYEKNIRMRKAFGLVNGQGNCAVSRHRLGIAKMSSNGCGAIAVYNALYAAGHNPDFNTISLGIDCFALRLWGVFGTDPDKMEKYFRKCRIAAVKAADYDDFVMVMSAVKVGILCYWVDKPKRSFLHFVAVINNGEGFDVCNRYSNRKTPSRVRSMGDFCPKECYVCGFYIS